MCASAGGPLGERPLERASNLLDIRVGIVSETGRRERNEDFAAASLGTAGQRHRQGAAAALEIGYRGRRFLEGIDARIAELEFEEAAGAGQAAGIDGELVICRGFGGGSE